MHDLVVANTRLRGKSGRHDIGIDGTRITTITEHERHGTLDGRQVVDAAGHLVTESFVNAHLHLDKV